MNARPAFERNMTKTQAVLGWIYLPLHAAIIPLLLALYQTVAPGTLDEAKANLIYFGAGLAFVLLALRGVLREGFDRFLDRPGRCLLSILSGVVISCVLGMLAAAVLLLLGQDGTNPNNAAVREMTGINFGVARALGIFIGPIVEEMLFRGVAFGTVRPFSRFWAYAVSAALFSLGHVWQYVLLSGDVRLLLYALQYLPPSLALCWCYERTGSIWTPVFLHMLINAMAFRVLDYI